MSERIQEEIREAVREAAGEPRSEVRERALAAMGTARPSGSRWGWVPTAVGAGLVIAALGLLPYSATAPPPGMGSALAAQQAMAAEAYGEMRGEGAGSKVTRENLPEWLTGYAERAPQFVREHYPDDPEMLMAAGLLTTDYDTGVALMKEALEKGGGGAVWAAYAGLLASRLPDYHRVGTWVVDPADPDAVARVEEKIAESGGPTKLAWGEVAAIMEVAREWAEAEPDSGMPLALETYYLYGLHRDQEALERWEEAASRPEVASHQQEFLWAISGLLVDMGEPELQAIQSSFSVAFEPTEAVTSAPRHCARMGGYEGRLARLEGRPDDAIRWWMATVQFGRHMQQSADTLMEGLVAISVEAIGGSPVWVWKPDRETGIPDGPLQGGRLFHGEHHDLFVSQAGEQAAEQVRDSMVRAKVRSQLSREYYKSFQGPPEGQLRSMMLRAYSFWYGLLVVVSLLVFAGVSLRARKRADEATTLSWPWRMLLALLALAPVSIAFALMSFALRKSIEQPGLQLVVSAGMALTLLSILLLPLLAAFRSRTAGARLVTAWRGNLRRVLPVGIVVLAALSLGLGITGRRAQAEWARNWLSETEMARVVREIGPEWEDPEIPPDAWRAEPPPGG